MKYLYYAFAAAFAISFTGVNYAQTETRDKGVFIESKNEFYDEILKGTAEFNKQTTTAKKTFKVDFSNIDAPKSINDYDYSWHNEQVSQGLAGTCWAFSTTSFFESEVYRINKEKIKLSEVYTAYWEYVEKAAYFVKQRGKSNFAEGSEADAVPRIWKKYGVVPLSAYSGLLPGQKFHDHSIMFNEMNEYLKSVAAQNAWNEDAVISTIKSIMKRYIGEPPAKFAVNGKEFTPKEYLEKVVKLNLDDYVDVLSILEQPYYEHVEYTVEDNWQHTKTYCNIPLDEFMKVLKNAIRKGYTLCIGGDVSEPGIDSHAKIAMVPTFDIPSQYIDEYAREFRFSNKTTGDDHGIHLVGFAERNGKDWYLIKDSGSGSKNVEPKGYYFFSEDYVKLKIMDFMVHKDALGDILEKIKK